MNPHRFVLALLAAVTVLCVGAESARAVDDWSISGRIVDSETGQPAAGVSYAVYEWNPWTHKLTLGVSGTVKDTGRFRATIVGDRPWAIVKVGQHRLYEDMWHKSMVIPYQWRDWEPSILSLSGAAAEATRYYRGSSFGDIRMKAKPQPYGALVGRVYDAYSGARVAMELTIWQWDAARTAWVPTGWMEGPNDHGYYAFLGSSSTDLTKEFRLSFLNYAQPEQVAFFPYGSTVDEAPSMRLQPGEVLYGVDLPVPRANRLRGHVIRTADKSGIENVAMRGYRYNSTTDSWVGDDFNRTTESGYYCSPVLEPGTHRIRAWDRYGSELTAYYGQSASLGSARDVVVHAGDVHSDLDIWLSDSSAVAGTVVDSTGQKRSDVRVTAYQSQDGTWVNRGSDYTDSNGRYRIMVPPGTYTVRFTDRAGTTDSTDDVFFYLGGVTDIDQADSVTVRDGRARVLNTFSIDAPEDCRGERVFGGSVCKSAVQASRIAFEAGEATQVVLAAAAKPQEALVAAGLAGAVDGPVLLTYGRSAYRPMLMELRRLGAEKVYIVGNTSSVSSRQYRLLRALGYRVVRTSGDDVYELSARTLSRIDAISGIETATPVYVISGKSRADSLIVGPAAYANKSAVLCVNPATYLQRQVVSAVKQAQVRRVYLVGDYGTLPSRSVKTLRVNGVAISRVATSTSVYSRATKFAAVAETRGWLAPTRFGLASTAAFGDALASPWALGRTQGAVLFVKPKELPTTTRRAIASRSARIDKVSAYARPSALSSRVIREAGDQ